MRYNIRYHKYILSYFVIFFEPALHPCNIICPQGCVAIEAMADGCVKMGLPRDMAIRMSAHSLLVSRANTRGHSLSLRHAPYTRTGLSYLRHFLPTSWEDCGRRDPLYRGAKLWDRIPENVQRSTTKVKFKAHIKDIKL